MKRVFALIGSLSLFSVSLFSSDQIQTMTPPKVEPWKQVIMDKMGWIEGGAKMLILSSNLTPIYTNESIPVASTSNNTLTNKQVVRSPNPEYNLGYGVFFRYRTPSNNDICTNYSYLRNNGNGRLKRTDTSTTAERSGDITSVLTQNDAAHYHSHMHLIDGQVGTPIFLTSWALIRLAGGLSYNDFYLYYQQRDVDSVVSSGGGTDQQTSSRTFYKEHHRFWGLGPKGEIDFKFLLFPSSWKHCLDFVLKTQFAILYSRDWSWGKYQLFEGVSDRITPTNDSLTIIDFDWDRGAHFHIVPNVNMDVGLQYCWQSRFNNVIFKLDFGYRVWAFWHIEELYEGRDLFAGVSVPVRETVRANSLENAVRANDDRLLYAGPYFSLSLAY